MHQLLKISLLGMLLCWAGSNAYSVYEQKPFIPGLSLDAQQAEHYKDYKDKSDLSSAFIDAYRKVIFSGEMQLYSFSGLSDQLNPCSGLKGSTADACTYGANAAIVEITNRLQELCGGNIPDCSEKNLKSITDPAQRKALLGCLKSWQTGYTDIGIPQCRPGFCSMSGAETSKNPNKTFIDPTVPRIDGMLSCAAAGYDVAVSSCDKIANTQAAPTLKKVVLENPTDFTLQAPSGVQPANP